MEVRGRNINEIFSKFVTLMEFERDSLPILEEDTRNGPVWSFEDPCIITYNNPLERVLFNPGRDCNPFFHLVESLWMLAGRNDVAIPAYFVSTMRDFSDDGKTFHAAYGHRWRRHFKLPPDEQLQKLQAGYTGYDHYNEYDQLNAIIGQLRQDKTTRRLCLGMWDPVADLYLLETNPKCKDVPCNTHAHFRVTEGKYLNLTVYNRSNDLVWGAFGANVVHMSFLQEYIALASGLRVGVYHQITNNLHVYRDKKKWKPKKFLENQIDYYANSSYPNQPSPPSVVRESMPPPCIGGEIPLLADSEPSTKAIFDAECIHLMELLDLHINVAALLNHDFKSPFIKDVAVPMIAAFVHHKNSRNYTSAQLCMGRCKASDWRQAGREWLLRREHSHSKRTPE